MRDLFVKFHTTIGSLFHFSFVEYDIIIFQFYLNSNLVFSYQTSRISFFGCDVLVPFRAETVFMRDLFVKFHTTIGSLFHFSFVEYDIIIFQFYLNSNLVFSHQTSRISFFGCDVLVPFRAEAVFAYQSPIFLCASRKTHRANAG